MTADNNFMKSFVWFVLLASMALSAASAAQREAAGGGAKIVNKLQTMVKEITSERDLLKAENAKVVAELETVKAQLKQDKDVATVAHEKLAADLATQKSTVDEVKVRLDNTTAKLREVIEKYNVLNKSKNDLSVVYANLQNTQQATASELKSCEAKNIKMFEGAKEVVEGFQRCQKRGFMDTLMGTEPFSQIKDVEFETIMQGYEDKLRKQKYQNKTPVPVSVKPALDALPVKSPNQAAQSSVTAPAQQTPQPLLPNTPKVAPVTPSVQTNPAKK